jgi:hypothetical protein
MAFILAETCLSSDEKSIELKIGQCSFQMQVCVSISLLEGWVNCRKAFSSHIWATQCPNEFLQLGLSFDNSLSFVDQVDFVVRFYASFPTPCWLLLAFLTQVNPNKQ